MRLLPFHSTHPFLPTRVRGGLGVTVEERQGRIHVKALPRETWDVPNQAEKAGVRIGDRLIGINDKEFSTKAMPLSELISAVRALPDKVTLHLHHIEAIDG